MDSEMVIEVPDTPERAFTRSVAESSSRICGIDDKPSSSSNGYLEPVTRTYSRHNKNSGSHGHNGNGVTSVDNDFFFSQARIARVISDIPDARRTHSSNISPKFEQSRVVIDNGTNPKTIDLSHGGLIRYRRSGNKEEKHLSCQRERNSISGYGRLHVRSSTSMEGVRKEKSNPGNSSKDLVTFSSTNEIDSLKCDSKEKITAQQLNSRPENEQFQSKDSEFGSPQRDARQKKLSNGFIPFCDLTGSSSSSNNGQAKPYHQEHDDSVDKGASLSHDVENHGIEIGDGSSKVSQSITKRAELRHQELVNPKNMFHRKLVRNGCISPNNIAKIKNDAKALEIDEGNVISSKISNSNSSQSVQCYSSKCRAFDKSKGKEVMKDEFVPSSQNIVDLSTYRRSCLMPQKEAIIISDMDYDTKRIQIDGCEASHKHMGGSSLLPSSDATCIISESENMSGHLPSFKSKISKGGTKYALSVGVKPEETTFQSGQHIGRVHGCLKPDSDAPQFTGKRKMNSTQSNAGECSSSTVDSMRISRDRASLKTSDQRSTRSRKSVRFDTGLAPIVEIDELDANTQEENHEISDESIARSMQLESDEVLARQLQEQFYLESPSVGAMERDAYLPALLGRPRFSHSSTRPTARTRTENRTGRMRRNMSRLSMSVEQRLDFLEALEALEATLEYDNGLETPSQLLDVQRDFNENDYEMLLALDENNHHVGASESQINNLPQSLFQSTDSEEACTICLEMPSFGEAIRHLPCLHKFHKDCIDPWLRRKRSCPICKSGIT